MNEIASLAPEQFCYLTTVGRKSGKQHTIEIWFAMPEQRPTLYMLAGGGYGADWVKNIQHEAGVEVRIGSRVFSGQGRIVEEPEEERLARKLVVRKYYGREKVEATGWEAEALPVAIDLDV